MKKKKSAPRGKSGLVPSQRRSERLRHKCVRTYQFDVSSDESESNTSAVAKTPSCKRAIYSTKATSKYKKTRGSSPILIEEVIARKLGNDNSNQQARYFANTSTSKVGTNEPMEECCNLNKEEERLRSVWWGSLSIGEDNFDKVDGYAACKLTKASPEFLKFAYSFPGLLAAEVLPRLDIWPNCFHTSPPTDDIIDLYFFPEDESDNKAFSSLLDYLSNQDLGMRIVVDDTKLLVFSSRHLPQKYWRTKDKYYMWAVVVGTNVFFPLKEEYPTPIRINESEVPPNSANDVDAATGDPTSIHIIESEVPPNSANDVDAAVRDESRSSKNWVAQGINNARDSPEELFQTSFEWPYPFGRAINEGLSERTSTTIADGFLGTKFSPDHIFEEAGTLRTRKTEENLQRVPERVKRPEAPLKMPFGSGLASAFLIPDEDFIPNYAEETFPSANIPDGGNVQRTGSGSSGLPRQSFDSAFQGHKGSGAYSKSVCTSFHNLANNFDDETFEEITSDGNCGELVGQYRVKPSLAQTLGAIIEKHGDIAQECPNMSSKMLSYVLERICEVVQDFQALKLKNLRHHHLDSLKSAILDGELVKVDVKWLKSRHDELNKVVNQIKESKKLKHFRRSNMKVIESKRSTLNSKKIELLKLQSQVESLENQISLLSAETESLGDDLSRAKQDFERFQRTSLMDGLL